jgi:hypothetical protein
MVDLLSILIFLLQAYLLRECGIGGRRLASVTRASNTHERESRPRSQKMDNIHSSVRNSRRGEER